MIRMFKGHDQQKDRNFFVASLESGDFKALSAPYSWMIWSMYHSVADYDFSVLPDLYGIAFKDMDQFSDHAINTGFDSDVIRVITGADKRTNGER